MSINFGRGGRVAEGDSSNWLLTTQALVLPLAAGGLIVLGSLFIGYEYPTPLRPQRETPLRQLA
jgi:hypothetical protein